MRPAAEPQSHHHQQRRQAQYSPIKHNSGKPSSSAFDAPNIIERDFYSAEHGYCRENQQDASRESQCAAASILNELVNPPGNNFTRPHDWLLLVKCSQRCLFVGIILWWLHLFVFVTEDICVSCYAGAGT